MTSARGQRRVGALGLLLPLYPWHPLFPLQSLRPTGRKWSLSPQQEQMLEPQLARVLDRPALVRRGADDLDRLGWIRARPSAWVPFRLRTKVPGKLDWQPALIDHLAKLGLPAHQAAQRSYAMPYSQPPNPSLVPRWLQNKPAVEEEEQVDRMSLRESFCGAAGGRASIYACKAFNTEESAGSIREPAEEPAPIAAPMLAGCIADCRAEPLQWQTWQSQFHPPFAARNTSL